MRTTKVYRYGSFRLEITRIKATLIAADIEGCLRTWCDYANYETGKCRLMETPYDNCRCKQQTRSILIAAGEDL